MVQKLLQNEAKIDPKTHRKILENLIDFLGCFWDDVRTPTREQIREPGRRGGVGEGLYVYSHTYLSEGVELGGD